jgi:hypothetical protein
MNLASASNVPESFDKDVDAGEAADRQFAGQVSKPHAGRVGERGESSAPTPACPAGDTQKRTADLSDGSCTSG